MYQPQPQHEPQKSTAFHKGLNEIKHEVDQTLEKMKKNHGYTPSREELGGIAKRFVELIRAHKPPVNPTKNALLMAIIDLTEVPVMHEKMQRVAFEVALKEASKNLDNYMHSM